MTFGSVKFFKALILTVIGLMILVPTVGCVVLKVENSRLQDQFIQVDAENVIYENKIEPGQEMIPYQALYPEMVCKDSPQEKVINPGTVYLTFDDGPTHYTEQILDTLAQYDVKATFFVIGRTGEQSTRLMKRIVDEGHTIGVHTYSHEYLELYRSPEAYLEDFNKIYTLIESNTGVKPEIFRFPGGSINAYNRAVYQEIIAEMMRRGFTYYDWNVSSEDVSANSSQYTVVNNILNKVNHKTHHIVLMHDTNDATMGALPTVIQNLLESGYKLDALTNEVRPSNFLYPRYY
ncbi:MAG: polysaccharide deacetylase [Eubacteriales bacterium]|nr:polysaccharide deacetylase [Eubacteriales bacterium]MDD4390682.1 polysaccharide deacetylase [Eubacteriales bacterium]